MWSTARDVAAGDLVIIWQTRELIQPLLITPGKDFNSRFGHYRHADLVGISYGSKVGSRNGKGFIHVLRPTPELWTMALPHRTQILYLADIAFITSWLDIKRGSRVIEAVWLQGETKRIHVVHPSFPIHSGVQHQVDEISIGTGSGSFSHSIARTIGSAGHLWSYEFHEARASKAREEFSLHGMADIVTLTHRNVCKDGFTVDDTVDAVFLDLPAPWDAIEHAKKALKKNVPTRICCFSPCMEQVLRTVSALNDLGFTDITMFESLLRPHEVHQTAPQPLTFAIEKLKKSEQKREEKRQNQIARSNKRKLEDLPEADIENVGGKRFKAQESAELGDVGVSNIPDDVVDPARPADHSSSIKLSVSKACPEVRGHTSYLTFARLVPTAPSSPTNRQ